MGELSKFCSKLGGKPPQWEVEDETHKHVFNMEGMRTSANGGELGELRGDIYALIVGLVGVGGLDQGGQLDRTGDSQTKFDSLQEDEGMFVRIINGTFNRVQEMGSRGSTGYVHERHTSARWVSFVGSDASGSGGLFGSSAGENIGNMGWVICFRPINQIPDVLLQLDYKSDSDEDEVNVQSMEPGQASHMADGIENKKADIKGLNARNQVRKKAGIFKGGTDGQTNYSWTYHY